MGLHGSSLQNKGKINSQIYAKLNEELIQKIRLTQVLSYAIDETGNAYL